MYVLQQELVGFLCTIGLFKVVLWKILIDNIRQSSSNSPAPSKHEGTLSHGGIQNILIQDIGVCRSVPSANPGSRSNFWPSGYTGSDRKIDTILCSMVSPSSSLKIFCFN
jgi:hypothetical protein